MNDYKVHRMQSQMAHKYFPEREELRLPSVLLQGKAKRNQKKTKAHIYGIVAGFITAAFFVPIAWLERGHLGFGGEWMAVGAAYYIISEFWR